MRSSIAVFGMLLAPLAPAIAQSPQPTYYYGHEWMWWWMPFHMLIPLLFFGLLVAGVIVLIRKLWPYDQWPGTPSRACDLLNERYAKGEIEREEYLRRRQDIQGS